MNTAFLLTLLALDVSAQTGPLLTCSEPIYDFGSLVSTQTVSHTFLLQNSGGGTAVISRIEVGCECTTAFSARTSIPPGECEPLDALLDLKGLTGPQNKSIAVTWDGSTRPPLLLVFRGTAVARMTNAPPPGAVAPIKE